MTVTVKDIMTRNPEIIDSSTSLQEAAKKMDESNCGIIPVGNSDKIEGVITDRDIVVRAVGKGKDCGREVVKDYMSTPTHFCKENETLEEIIKKMQQYNINRLVVKDSGDHICGIISFGDVVRNSSDSEEVGEALKDWVDEETKKGNRPH